MIRANWLALYKTKRGKLCYFLVQMLKINDLVSFNEQQGYVKYIGAVHFRPGVWVGIELTNSTGKNDGEIEANGSKRRYFKCKPNHGLFAKKSAVLKVSIKARIPRKNSLQNTISAFTGTSQHSHQSLINNTAVLKSTLEEYQNQITIKDSEIEQKDLKISELQYELITNQRTMHDMEVKLDKFTLDMMSFEEKFDPNTIKELKVENKKLQESLTEADGEIKMIQEHYSKIIDSQKATLQKLQDSGAVMSKDEGPSENKKLKMTIEEQAAKISHLELLLESSNGYESNSKAGDNGFELQKLMHDYQMKIADLEVQLNSSEAKTELANTQTIQFENELNYSRDALLVLQKEKSNLLSQVGTLKAENSLIQKKMQSNTPIESATVDSVGDSEEITYLKSERQSLEDLFEIKENNLKNEIVMLKKSNNMLKEKVASLSSDYHRKSSEIVEISKNLLHLENESKQTISELEAEVDELVHEKLVIENEVKTIDTTITRLKEEAVSLRAENDRLKKLSSSLKKSRRQTMSSYMENVDRLMSDMSKIQDTMTEKKSTTSNRASTDKDFKPTSILSNNTSVVQEDTASMTDENQLASGTSASPEM